MFKYKNYLNEYIFVFNPLYEYHCNYLRHKYGQNKELLKIDVMHNLQKFVFTYRCNWHYDEFGQVVINSGMQSF